MEKTTTYIGNIKNLTDEELINQFKELGHTEYAGELYSRYAHLVYGNCRNYFSNSHDCEDMVMLVFEKLLQKLPTYNVNSFPNWLFVLVKNECLTQLRKRKVKSNHHSEWEINEKNTQNYVENASVARLHKEDETKEEQLEQAIQQLPLEQQTCIRLFYYDKKSYNEIIAQTNFTSKQVKSYLQNGKRNLRKQLTAVVFLFILMIL